MNYSERIRKKIITADKTVIQTMKAMDESFNNSFEFEGFGMKIKGSLVGLILIVIGIVMYFTTSNFNAEIEN